jgi:hypothetical protein
MINHLRYDLDSKNQITAEVPMIAYDQAMKETRLPEVIEGEAQLVSVTLGKGGVHLTLTDQWFKEKKREMHNVEAGASQWLYALTSTKRFTPPEMIDPLLEVNMAQSSSGDLSGQQRLQFSAELGWPLQDYEAASQRATQVMRKMALTFGYIDKSNVKEGVFANANHEHGITLEALDVGSCSVDTDGMLFSSSERQAHLVGHNLYNRQLMLTCFSGLVALARTR